MGNGGRPLLEILGVRSDKYQTNWAFPKNLFI